MGFDGMKSFRRNIPSPSAGVKYVFFSIILPTSSHGVTTQRSNRLIVTALRTSDLTHRNELPEGKGKKALKKHTV
jgi:hypothetical protein